MIVVGGVYYMLPSWRDLPSQSTLEDASASILLSPVNVAAKIGTKMGDGFMSAMGYEYTPEELKMTRQQLLAQANVPNTPANAAQTLYEILAALGQLEQLREARIALLGGTDVEWNASVFAAYYPMYSQRLQDAINAYVNSSL